jgi:pimeloyl-ACP methyl ester carboxylesterase
VLTRDERVEGARCMLDAAGSDRRVVRAARLLRCSEGGPMALLFAVSDAERVEALLLAEAAASFRSDAETAPHRHRSHPPLSRGGEACRRPAAS